MRIFWAIIGVILLIAGLLLIFLTINWVLGLILTIVGILLVLVTTGFFFLDGFDISDIF